MKFGDARRPLSEEKERRSAMPVHKWGDSVDAGAGVNTHCLGAIIEYALSDARCRGVHFHREYFGDMPVSRGSASLPPALITEIAKQTMG